MTELTEQQAREALNALSLNELVELAEQQGYPTANVGKEDLVERLLGKCPGCKKKD